MCESYVLKSFMFLQVQKHLVFAHEKVRDLHLCSIECDQDGLTSYFCFSVPYALCIGKIMIKKVTTCLQLLTYCNFFQHQTHTQIYISISISICISISISIYIYIYIYIYITFTFILASAIKFEVTRSSLKMFGVSTPLQTMHPSPVQIYRGVEIFEK